jgi:hypothetical protein
MTRRRFAFWVGFGLFGLAEKLRAEVLDDLAAATMRVGESSPAAAKASMPVHWRAAGDETWSWYERENFIDEQWILTGTTTPIDKKTGQPKADEEVYLDESLVPPEMRRREQSRSAESHDKATDQPNLQLPTAKRRSRHGRPPSKWLRSLNADELRIWLKTIDVPEAGVSGMTYWEHLTRDHSFDPAKIEGLSVDEQAKLHAAAHFGY